MENNEMQAAVLYGPGDLRLTTTRIPCPGDNEVLLKVKACAICGSDPKVIKKGWPGSPPFGEFIPGHEYSGEVVVLGKGVTEFELGDRVVIEPHKGCGICMNCIRGLYTTCLNYAKTEKGHRHYGFTTNGGYAEYAVNHINTLHKIPDNISFEEATVITAAGTCLYGIERIGGIYPGEVVTVIGPGPIGLACVQVAKALGAGKVILVGTRDSRLKVGAEMGADICINSNEENAADAICRVTKNLGSDLTIECSGNSAGATTSVEVTRKSGRIAFVGIYDKKVELDLNRVVQFNMQMAGGKAEGMWCIERILPLMADRRINLMPMITHTFPLSDINKALSVFINRIDDAIKVIIKL